MAKRLYKISRFAQRYKLVKKSKSTKRSSLEMGATLHFRSKTGYSEE